MYRNLLNLIPMFAFSALLVPAIVQVDGHLLLHGSIVVLSLLLLSVSAFAYVRDRRIKLLFISGAFLVFTIRESVLLLGLSYSGVDFMIPIVGSELTHVLGFTMVALFGMGTLRR